MINGKTTHAISDLTSARSAHETLLATKHHPPSFRAQRVQRAHLLDRLDQSLTHKLALICAPAGFGKTTLLCEWFQRRERSVAWLSLDAEDNDPIRFWSYVLAALESLDLDIDLPAIGGLRSPHRAAIETMLTLLINAASSARDDFVLILDDYHVIESPEIHEGLAFLLEHLPARMHVLIASRSEPPLPLARLRANEQLIQLQSLDLRFDMNEATTFFKDVIQIDLSSSHVHELARLSEGWIAGLQMAGLALQSLPRENAEGFVAEFRGHDRYVVDYLVEEVLQHQSEEIREFLLCTSILERFNAELCSAILVEEESSNVQTLLETIERRNLFVVSLDRERHWYRYHHLFADFLRRVLHRSHPDRLPDLHRRASMWFEQHGSLDEAIQHALNGGDVERAARLIDCAAERLMERGEVIRLQKWLCALPESMLRERAELCLWFAWTLALTSRLDEVELYLSRAEEAFERDQQTLRDREDEQAQCKRHYVKFKLNEAASIRALVARYRGDLPRTIEFAQQVLKDTPRHERTMRSIASMNLGQAYLLNGDMSMAGQALYEAEVASRAAGHSYIHLSVLMFQARLRTLQGRLHRAADIYLRALHMTEQLAPQSNTALSGVPRIGLGDLHREWNELDEALSELSIGIQLSVHSGDFNYLRDGYIALARVKQARGEIDAALEDLHRAEQLAQRSRTSPDIACVEAWRTRMWIAQGDVSLATQWAAQCHLPLNTMHNRYFYLHDVEYLTLARVWIAQHSEASLRDADRLLARMRKAVEKVERNGTLIEVMMLQARVADAQSKRKIAVDLLREALMLAEPEGYVRLFVDEGAAMRELLQRVATHEASESYASRLLRVLGDVEPSHTHVVAKTSMLLNNLDVSVMVEPLSDRETDILRHLATGMSSREIAQALSIAVSTVRWHTKNVYSKLGVRNRTEAALLARQIGLSL